VQVQDERPGRALRDERVDDRGHVIESRSQDGRCRRFAEPHAGVVGRDDMKPIRQSRNEVVELVRRGGKTVQQDDSRLRRVPGLAVEDVYSVNRSRAKVCGCLTCGELRHHVLFPRMYFQPEPERAWHSCRLASSCTS